MDMAENQAAITHSLSHVLVRSLIRLAPAQRAEQTISEGVNAFLTRKMPATTHRSYSQTLNRLANQHGELALEAMGPQVLEAFIAEVWTECAPATWNRHVAVLRSFTAFSRRKGWLSHDPAAVLERRKEPADRTRAIAPRSLERLFK